MLTGKHTRICVLIPFGEKEHLSPDYRKNSNPNHIVFPSISYLDGLDLDEKT